MEAANTNNEKQWYAIRVTYNRELKVKADLDAQGIDNFIPMKYVSVMRGKDRRVKKLVPAIHNLIFMLVDRNTMVQYKATTTLPIRYIMNRETHQPVVIPRKQMDNFIAVAGNYNEQLLYLENDPITLHKGDKVLALAKTITTIQIKLPLNRDVYTKTMLMARHQRIAKLFDEDFWVTQ